MASKDCSAEVGKSQKIRSPRTLEVRQLLMISVRMATADLLLPGPPGPDTPSVSPSARPSCPSGQACYDLRYSMSIHPPSNRAL